MSFRCQGCSSIALKPSRVVTKMRAHKHTESREIEGQIVSIVVGEGTQIVEEKSLCEKCANFGL